MKLSFKEDEHEILVLSKRIAVAYVRATGLFSEWDDARQDAALLLAQTEFDDSYPRSARRAYLTRRCVMALLRERQKRTGARLRRPPEFQSFGELDPPDRRSSGVDVVAIGATVAAKEELSDRDRRIVDAWLAGVGQVEIARRFEISQSRVSRIVKQYKDAARRLKGDVVKNEQNRESASP